MRLYGKQGFWAVVAVALLLRLGFLLLFSGNPVPDSWKTPGVAQGAEIGSIARNLAEGRGFSSPFGNGDQPTSWFGPIVPWVWSWVFRGFGIFSDRSLALVLGLQALASALACGFYAATVSELRRRGEPTHDGSESGHPSHIASWFVPVTVILLVLWPESYLSVARPWYCTYQEAGLAALFWYALRWNRLQTPWRGTVVLGLLSGLLCLINPVPWVFFLWVTAGVSWSRWQRSKTERGSHVGLPRSLFPSSLAIAVSVLVFTPWLVRNYRAFGTLSFVRTNLGVELYQGNHAHGDISQNADSPHPALDAVERTRYRELGEVAYSREQQAQAFEFMRAHPWVTCKRTLQKAYVYWCGDLFGQWPWSRERAAPSWHSRIHLRRVVLCFLPFLALVFALTRCRWKHLPAGWMFLGMFLLVPLPYYVTHVNFGYAYVVRPFMLILTIAAFATRSSRTGERDFTDQEASPGEALAVQSPLPAETTTSPS